MRLVSLYFFVMFLLIKVADDRRPPSPSRGLRDEGEDPFLQKHCRTLLLYDTLPLTEYSWFLILLTSYLDSPA